MNRPLAAMIACAVPFCSRRVRAAFDAEALCGKHWRLVDGAQRRLYEAAWIDAEEADCEGREDVEAYQRVTRAWRDLVDLAVRKSM